MARAGRAVLYGLGVCVRGCMGFMGLFTMALACGLVADVVFVMAAIVVPRVTPRGTALFWPNFLLMCALGFGIFFNYIMACITPPGHVPSTFVAPSAAAPTLEEGAPDRSARRPYWCRTCNTAKPSRTHHCSLCNECVLKMDHHCPWINGCVGFHNQRYFDLFLVTLLLGTSYACGEIAHMCWLHSDTAAPHYAGACSGSQVVFTFILCAAIFFAMAFFVLWHAYLALTNQTSIEWSGGLDPSRSMRDALRSKTQFNLGPLRNLVEVFGDSTVHLTPVCGQCEGADFVVAGHRGGVLGVLWMLLPSLQPLHHDGTEFPTRAAV